jgi:hypothetical protein
MRPLSLLCVLLGFVTPARAELVFQSRTAEERPTNWEQTLHFDIPEGVKSVLLIGIAHLHHGFDVSGGVGTLTAGPSSILSPYFDFEFPLVFRGEGDVTPASFLATTAVDVPVEPGPFDVRALARSFSSFVTLSGNGSGTVTTTASLDLTIEYQAPVTIPEPASLVMLGIGAVALIGVQWNKRFC